MKIAFLGGAFTGRMGLVETNGGAGGTVAVLPKGVGLADLSRPPPAPAAELPLGEAVLEAPVLTDARIICVGLNFRSHAEELGMAIPERPSVFPRFSSSLVGPGRDVVLPAASAQLDYEVELAAVIGRHGRHIPASEAAAHVLGYTCMAENSVRDWQTHNRQVFPGKNFDGSGAIGPWIVTPDEMPPTADLRLETLVNGEVRQQGVGTDMIFSVEDCIAYVSTFMALRPGDVIALGTPPGVAFGKPDPQWLKDGDVVEMRISGIGSLCNTVRAEQRGEKR
ncbi:fumarylacetoacetate hydrolase family protein [Azospirillum canadense]|uniref:fumarylacetoacetate hydrolase family protein n=1 Tax=Azospirillum canadense TaxID=403962 RepID=UPI0022265E2B|nr:fumarylacetoacetate hydrolase family protein [Azospirillum canadense]MCW2241942.1 2-keto-4-pentenoate hydratase/2-oxohepta-3-ene-1,7-dioic acid hydratase in catechol pathway [Azospirillum canadense]